MTIYTHTYVPHLISSSLEHMGNVRKSSALFRYTFFGMPSADVTKHVQPTNPCFVFWRKYVFLLNYLANVVTHKLRVRSLFLLPFGVRHFEALVPWILVRSARMKCENLLGFSRFVWSGLKWMSHNLEVISGKMVLDSLALVELCHASKYSCWFQAIVRRRWPSWLQWGRLESEKPRTFKGTCPRSHQWTQTRLNMSHNESFISTRCG